MVQVKIAIYYFGQLIMYLIFGRAILSWFIKDYNNPIMSLLVGLTEPILKPIRSLLSNFNLGGTMIDFSPLVAMLVIQLIVGLAFRVL